MFKNKVLLVTGGTGSFGNAVIGRMLKEDLREIRVFSRDEKKQDEMRNSLQDERLTFVLGDVRDSLSVNSVMRGVNYLFHAAALKQVPSCEFYPMEAVKTNILGAENVMSAAHEHGVERGIILSTDKAVYPINAMGMSKAMMERVMVAKARDIGSAGTTFCVTRYGNVMASRGSVIPLFLDLISKGRPLTVTDPTMTRFLMSLEESVDLVLHAFKHGNQGDLFVQKASASTIEDLANAFIDLFDHKPGVRLIGTRHGEKLYESLLSREERAKSVDEEGYFRVPMDGRGMNYSQFYSQGDQFPDGVTDYTSHNTVRLNKMQVIELISRLDVVRRALNNA